MDSEPTDIEAAADSAASVAELALLLRQLRRRDARARNAAERTHRELAALVGCSAASVGFYLSGAVLPPARRLAELVGRLGATPGERRALIAARDRVTEAASSRAAWPSTTAEIPRTLPPAPAGFVGRAAELAALEAAVGAVPTEAPAGRAPVVISALSGMGGVGKTALALHWAYRSAPLFPDGQLYVNLRGYGPGEPVTVAAALQVLLDGLGVPAASLPSDVDDRTTLYREVLRGRRVLVLLDNAAGADQVRALLPPTPGIAMVTSRDRMPELAAEHGAGVLALDVMSEAEADELLRGLVGERCDREPQAARALLRRCGRLPLALRVVAEIAAARPMVPLADLVAELGTDQPSLDGFETGDASTDLRQVFSWSVRTLPGPGARAFRLLGLAPTELVDVFGMAALAGTDPTQARELLDALVRAHLIITAGSGRYRVHDLLRAYANELAERELHPDGRRAARHRQLDYYLAAAGAATAVRYPYRLGVQACRPPQPLDEVRIPSMSTVEAARSWLSAERSALVRLAVGAAGAGQPAHAVALALALAPVLDGDFSDDALAVFRAAHAAVAAGGAPMDEAQLERCLGYTYLNLGRLDDASACFARALAGFAEHGQARDTMAGVGGLGILRAIEGRFEEARSYLQRGLRLAQDAGLSMHEALAWGNLAALCVDLEDWDGARECADHALAVAADQKQAARPHVYVCLARAAEGRGRFDEATEHGLASLDLASAYGDAIGQVHALEVLASIHHRLGRYDEAIQSLESTLQTHRQHCRAQLLAQVLNTLGCVYLDAAAPSLAQGRHAQARRYAERAGARLQVSRALLGLGDAHLAQGEPVPARSCWREALTAYTQMQHPAAERVRARLAGR